MSKYGHLAKMHPAIIPLIPTLEENNRVSWSKVLDTATPDITAFKQPMSDGNPASLVPDTFPQPSRDYLVHDESFAARDGVSIGIRVYAPLPEKRQGKGDVVVVKFHGGGWVVGSHDIEEIENRLLVVDGGNVVVSVAYRMAPEYKFPIAVWDCYDGLKWTVSNADRLGVDKKRVVLSGGSAGGNLVSAIALMARDLGFEKDTGGRVVGVAAQIPVTCHPDLFPRERYEYTSLEQNKDSQILKTRNMLWFWEQYVGKDVGVDMGEKREYHSPLLAGSLKGLPPFLVQVAGADPLRDEGLAWAERLKEEGVKVDLKVFPGLPHGFYFLHHLEESKEHWQNIVDFVRRVTGSEGKL